MFEEQWRETMNQTLQDMVQELWNREAIRQCLTRYARGVDRFDRDLILSAFHPDAIDEHGKFVGGPREFVDWALAQHQRAHLTHQHCLLNHTCEFDGDIAYTETYFMFVGMNRKGKPLVMNGGRYIDRFEKRDGHWRIGYRICLRDWGMMDQIPNINDLSSFTSTRAHLSEAERAFMNAGLASSRSVEDPSYLRPIEPDPQRLRAYAKLRETLSLQKTS